MPINAGEPFPEQSNLFPQPELTHAATFALEDPIVLPENFNELSPEEQERIKARLRFMGIRLRSDLKFETVTLTKETLDIP